MTIKLITIYLMSLFYIFAGAQHFANTDWYMKIMPPYLPYHKELVYLSGFFEIILRSISFKCSLSAPGASAFLSNW